MKFGVDFDVMCSDVPKLPRLEIRAYPNIPLTLTHAERSQALRLYYTGCSVIVPRFLRAIMLYLRYQTQAKEDLSLSHTQA